MILALISRELGADAETALAAFLTARAAYLEHRSDVTEATLLAVQRCLSKALGLSAAETQQEGERLKACLVWEREIRDGRRRQGFDA